MLVTLKTTAASTDPESSATQYNHKYLAVPFPNIKCTIVGPVATEGLNAPPLIDPLYIIIIKQLLNIQTNTKCTS